MEASWAVSEASWERWRSFGPSWRHLEAILGRLGAILAVLGANLEAILGHLANLEAILSRLGGLFVDVVLVCAAFRVAGGTGRSPRGSSFGKEPKPKPKNSSTPGTPVINQQGAADRRRLRRVTAAPCLLAYAYVAELWAQRLVKLSDHAFPEPLGEPFGEHVWEEEENEENEEEAVFGSILGHLGLSWGHIGCLWGRLRALLGPSWGHLGPPWWSLGLSWGRQAIMQGAAG